MTYLRIWKFRPAPGREDAFAAAYGPDGAWPALFGKADGYLGTELYRPDRPGGWWLTIDRWASAEGFERFGAQFGAEYRALDARLEGVAGDEQFVGAFGSGPAEGHMDDT
ncbi:MAG TPA: antibiotic biosynthesis monooxygenase [Sphingomicrobium sp.]|nr:antibiotic biosynthesis monooxygenase [Sphingomicrobium sp.]